MDSNISKIIETLSKAVKNKQLPPLYNNAFERWIFRILGVSLFLFLGLFAIEETRVYSAYFLAFSFLLIILYAVSGAIFMAKELKNPTRSYLDRLGEYIEKESSVINELSCFHSVQLETALDRLEFEASRIQTRISFLVGALEKLGVIPAIVGLYFTYTKIIGNGLDEFSSDLFLAVLVGFYLGSFALSSIHRQLQSMTFYLNRAFQIAKSREEFASECSKT